MPAQRSERDIIAALHRARVSMWSFDVQSRTWTIEPDVQLALKLADRSHEAVFGAWLDLLDPQEDRDRVALAFERACTGADVLDITCTIILFGHTRHARVTAKLALDADGTALRLDGAVIDTTEQVERTVALANANEALRLREEELTLLIDRSPGALLVIDEQERVVTVNDRFVALFGYTRDEIPTVEAWKRAAWPDPDYLAELDARREELVSRARREGMRATSAAEVRIRCRDGSYVDVEGSVALFDDRRIILFHDVTARARHEAELRRAAAVFHGGLQGVAITDDALQIAAVNGAFARLVARPASQMIGAALLSALDTGEPGIPLQRLLADLTARGRCEGEAWCRRGDGTRVAVHLLGVAVTDAGGRVVDHVVTVSDVTAARTAERELAYLAHHDPLTRLANRHRFADVLRAALVTAQTNGTRVAVLFLDLDHFKTVNDSLGHAVGDQLLARVAKRLTENVREHDMLARLGGDEFVVVVRDAGDSDSLAAVAERMVRAFDAPFDVDGRELRVGVSIGVSVFPDDSDSADAMLRNADAAMYLTKDGGRGGYRFYDATLTTRALDRLTVELELRRALADDALGIEYQPLIDLDSGGMISCEALARWPVNGTSTVEPAAFIAVAERTGLIDVLGAWVLRRACETARPWVERGWIQRVAVNVSGRQILRGGFVDIVRDALATSGLPAAALELELTETFVMTNIVSALDQLQALRALGVWLSIDDFGTGYSSLAYLKRLPVQSLKIDQSFVAGIDEEPDDVAIVRAVIALGKALGLSVVAEGVERESQLSVVKALGCHVAQGFLVGRPMSSDEFEAFAEARTTS